MTDGRWDRTVRRVAFVVFAATAVVFLVIFADPDDWKCPDGETVRLFGAAFMLFASLLAAFWFSVEEALSAAAWFRGLNVVLLGVVTMLSLLAMSFHWTHFGHTAFIVVGLAVYVAWDELGIRYYRTRSPGHYNRYRRNKRWDAIFLLATMICSAPVLLPDVRLLVRESAAAPQPHSTSSKHRSRSPGAKTEDPCPAGADAWYETMADFMTGGALAVQVLFIVMFSFLSSDENKPQGRRRSIGCLPVEEGYDLIAPVYDNGNLVMAVEQSHTLRRLRELAVRGVAMDLGCGTGRYLSVLAERAAQVIGVERSTAMLRECREKVAGLKNVQLIEASVIDLPSTVNESVDCATCCLVVDHLDNFEYLAMLSEAARVLKPGGWLYISVVNPYFELLEECFAKFLDADGVLQRIQAYPHTTSESLELLAKAGLSIVEVREEAVTAEHLNGVAELARLEGFPLIVSYVVRKEEQRGRLPSFINLATPP